MANISHSRWVVLGFFCYITSLEEKLRWKHVVVYEKYLGKKIVDYFTIPVTQQLLFIIIHRGTGNNSHLIFQNNPIILQRDSFLNSTIAKRQEKIW